MLLQVVHGKDAIQGPGPDLVGAWQKLLAVSVQINGEKKRWAREGLQPEWKRQAESERLTLNPRSLIQPGLSEAP